MKSETGRRRERVGKLIKWKQMMEEESYDKIRGKEDEEAEFVKVKKIQTRCIYTQVRKCKMD